MAVGGSEEARRYARSFIYSIKHSWSTIVYFGLVIGGQYFGLVIGGQNMYKVCTFDQSLLHLAQDF